VPLIPRVVLLLLLLLLLLLPLQTGCLPAVPVRSDGGGLVRRALREDGTVEVGEGVDRRGGSGGGPSAQPLMLIKDVGTAPDTSTSIPLGCLPAPPPPPPSRTSFPP
jgi:hypothetical protein